MVSRDTAEKVRDLTVSVYGFAREYGESRDIIISDTKFEFGHHDGEIDPDRRDPISRFVPVLPP
jgi:phosphoribosylaminoimidazole-succinocarboxamide synthase